MLVISTNVLVKHHESKTNEGQHFQKRRHKLVFLSDLETKVLFFFFKWPFSIFFTFLLPLTLKTTFVTICTKCPFQAKSSVWTLRRTKRKDAPRRLVHILKFELSRFCLRSLRGVRRKTILSVQKVQYRLKQLICTDWRWIVAPRSKTSNELWDIWRLLPRKFVSRFFKRCEKKKLKWKTQMSFKENKRLKQRIKLYAAQQTGN